MTFKCTPKLLLLIGLLTTATATAAFADTVVKVRLTGESHEKMGLEATPSSVPAGKVEFDVTNAAMKTGHEMILVKLASKSETLPLDPAKHRIDEKAIKSLGEVSNLKAGAVGVLKASVTPGDYMLICNIKGHYEAGMAAPFTVTP
ncbi:sulfocyanin-like copper-binding protein [Lichenihabitans psoromatis]|uniref:sulfocyanin-like copper-binding protein n=1 Tax=Lichenihabitans psoromatis TaxID=2528642 RepID=UPI0010365BC0|nr:sulfocyanin-like copper-binding protein [Lichenihabitans psoromatis]